MQKLFRNGYGELCSRNEMINQITNYIASDIGANYEITVGTDSQNHLKTKMTEVICVRRIGKGGIYFHYSEFLPRILSLRDKIYEETSRSIENARGLMDEVELNLLEKNIDINKLNIHFIIHCDIGHYGKTNELIKEIVGWVDSLGYEVAIKPDSWAASSVANKYSK